MLNTQAFRSKDPGGGTCTENRPPSSASEDGASSSLWESQRPSVASPSACGGVCPSRRTSRSTVANDLPLLRPGVLISARTHARTHRSQEDNEPPVRPRSVGTCVDVLGSSRRGSSAQLVATLLPDGAAAMFTEETNPVFPSFTCRFGYAFVSIYCCSSRSGYIHLNLTSTQ